MDGALNLVFFQTKSGDYSFQFGIISSDYFGFLLISDFFVLNPLQSQK
jgi:hypothetical protein